MTTTTIRATELQLGDTVLMGSVLNPYPRTVDTLEVRANDSIFPHVLINGIYTVALRGSVDTLR